METVIYAASVIFARPGVKRFFYENVYLFSRLEALNRVNVVAVTTILVLHVGVIGHHVDRRI